jgi:hypothetical protein
VRDVLAFRVNDVERRLVDWFRRRGIEPDGGTNYTDRDRLKDRKFSRGWYDPIVTVDGKPVNIRELAEAIVDGEIGP